MLDSECSHLQNKITELQNKLMLSDHYKKRLKDDIQDIITPVDLEQKNLKLIVSSLSYLHTYYSYLFINIIDTC